MKLAAGIVGDPKSTYAVTRVVVFNISLHVDYLTNRVRVDVACIVFVLFDEPYELRPALLNISALTLNPWTHFALAKAIDSRIEASLLYKTISRNRTKRTKGYFSDTG